jgi:cell division septum initiation protein DivIVA
MKRGRCFSNYTKTAVSSAKASLQNQLSNAEAHAQATTDFAAAQAAALANPATAASWPLQSAAYQQKVDNAYDTFRTEGRKRSNGQ